MDPTKMENCNKTAECSMPGSVETPISLAMIATLIMGAIAIVEGTLLALSNWGLVTVVGGSLTIGAVSIGAAGVTGTIAGAVAVIVITTVIARMAKERCEEVEGDPECISGVVHEIFPSYSSFWDNAFPFTAMHDRVDLVVKSQHWDIVKLKDAFVYCTKATAKRRSMIMRTYYYDESVCAAATASAFGSALGGLGGLAAGVAVAVAIGCATVILCLFAILAALLIAAAAALAGAFAAGQIAKAAVGDEPPSVIPGFMLEVGDLVSLQGNLVKREADGGANILWWVSHTTYVGRAPSHWERPFSYCDVDEGIPLALDVCKSKVSPGSVFHPPN
jgi:hypothetical protein